MEEVKKEKSFKLHEEKFVHDYSVDHKGRLPLRASTGVWKASLFIITIEFSERLSYFGIATSLIIYLTKVIHQDLKTAAQSVNHWAGVTTMMPLVGGFIADAYMGRFSTVLLSSVIYLLGLLLLAMSRVIPSWKPCTSSLCHKPRKVHEVVFFLAIYLISIGTGGHKPSLESFGADQFDDDHPEERREKLSFFNWWNCGLCSGLITAVTVIVYVQDNVGWAAADIILTCIMASTIVIFCMGRPFYRFRIPSGSPLTPMLQVLVAAITKRKLRLPSSPDQLYEVPKSANTQGRLLGHTEGLRFLDKAAIIKDKQSSVDTQGTPWKLTTVTKIEETKLILKTIPIWLTSLTFGICQAQTSTFFIKQSTTMDRNITHSFVIPPASVYSLTAIGMIISVIIYDKLLVPILRWATGNERGISILQRIGTGMVFTFATMVVAALVERKRLNLYHEDPIKGSLSMSVFWLAPQFLIIGMGDGFSLVGLQEYFYDQVPDSMRSLGIGLYLSVLGVANFLSSFLITIVDRATEKGGKSWFGKDLNHSRLDYFYWLLAAISALNFGVYLIVAQRYSYKNVQERGALAIADCYEGDSNEAIP
ncbi:putative peptide/nitrate transporter-like [Heracleum sosnowskyi]|uniref:Peptide/nitrate transporter-like n=1 Tax=Heracleum sosnowskyi TaxID=360622 RepID=A0AAD8GSX7_9APIA|nr:putative peptide/nitrate transporter-like [Heracleum sosnowskyi]